VDGETDARFAGGKHLEYTIPDLKDEAYESYKLQAGQPVTIEYTATLNSQAVVGVAGNPNEYTVRFSNNPSNTDNKFTTPPNTAIVLTYKFVFNKYDDERRPLTGADFELYKFVTDNNAQNGVWTKVTELHAGTSASNPTKVVSSNGETSNSVFTFSGLDDGDYKLVETVTPAGYNTVKDMYFTGSAGHTIKAADSVDLSLTGAKTTAHGESADITLAPYNESGSLTGLTANVVNPSGSKLPETGGIGTTIFYIVGGTLMVVSAVAFVTKRRMRTSA
jgi:LPXTG-motif cell wall-anchored protein